MSLYRYEQTSIIDEIRVVKNAAGGLRAYVHAREGAARMQQIVRDLRSLARAGTQELFYVDVRAVIDRNLLSTIFVCQEMAKAMMGGLIDELLDFSRLGRSPLAAAPRLNSQPSADDLRAERRKMIRSSSRA